MGQGIGSQVIGSHTPEIFFDFFFDSFCVTARREGAAAACGKERVREAEGTMEVCWGQVIESQVIRSLTPEEVFFS